MTAIIKEVIIGDCRLILGDCRDVLPELGAVADLLFCDVAYELTSGGNAHQSMGGIFATDRYNNDGKLMDCPKWHELGGPFYRACKPDSDCYIMTNDKNLFLAHGAFDGAGFGFHNLLVWNKIRATRNRWYMKNLEFTLYFWKGRADPKGINDCGSKQSFSLNSKRQTAHPTEKPVALLDHYILNSSNRDDTVLDPMMGSAAAMVSAVQHGRRGIGIEIEPEWFEVACQRVSAAYEARKNGAESLEIEGAA